jgi:hypothetical protein
MRWERTDERDRTYSRWHRQFTGDYRFIDIDHVEYCPYCNEPLALIETAVDKGQKSKCADITTLIAKKINVCSLIALYTPNGEKSIEKFRIMFTNPETNFWIELNSQEYLNLLKSMHEQHKKYCKGEK